MMMNREGVATLNEPLSKAKANRRSSGSFSANNARDAAENKRKVFEKARKYIKPGPFFKFVSLFFAERRLIVFLLAHFVASVVVWVHYGMIKYQDQVTAVPRDAKHYWLKLFGPPVEFGAEHAILFQMALLPLKMSRFTIANLSSFTSLSKFVPLNRMLRIHIHFGYIMISLVYLATIYIFSYFGTLCNDGEQTFCDKFTGEIMVTGYVILLCLMIVGGTSYFRYSIPYEVFYIIHHTVFVMYIVVIAHTFDDVERKGQKNRSQTFRWFTASFLWYICDRAIMYVNNRYLVPIVASAVITSRHQDSRMILVRLRRPLLFRFKPGQYAFLKMDAIEPHWHPFTIASGPRSRTLDFYIEVFKSDSWTGRLFSVLEESQHNDRITHWIQVMGPCGTPLANVDDFSHCLGIGSGTGIVPMLSLLQQHVRQLLRLQPEQYLQTLKHHNEHIHEIELAKEPLKGSLVSKVIKWCCGRRCKTDGLSDYTAGVLSTSAMSEEGVSSSTRTSRRASLQSNINRHSQLGNLDQSRNMTEMKKVAAIEMRSIYMVAIMTVMPVYGIALISFAISWNTVPVAIHKGMSEVLASATIFFQIIFAFTALGFWDLNSGIFSYVDVVFVILAPFSDWFYFYFDIWTNMTFLQLVGYLISIVYMTVRFWNEVVKSRHQSFRRDAVHDGITTLEKLDLVWVARSAVLVSEIMPDINTIWNSLVQAWGAEHAQKVLRITVYITDKNERACNLVRKELSNTDLFRRGAFEFGRPNLARVVEDFTLDRVVEDRAQSYSLLAFCGSPRLASDLHNIKITNDMSAAITGNVYHQMEFVAESYGGYKPSGKPKRRKGATDSEKPLEKSPPSSKPADGRPGLYPSSALSSRKISGFELSSMADVDRMETMEEDEGDAANAI